LIRRRLSCHPGRGPPLPPTLIGLAQIREDADPGPAPTILHLFAHSGGTLPDGLSSWDRDFLKALYDTNVDAVMQVSQIKVRLDQELAR
jgi:hypothetical protein